MTSQNEPVSCCLDLDQANTIAAAANMRATMMMAVIFIRRTEPRLFQLASWGLESSTTEQEFIDTQVVPPLAARACLSRGSCMSCKELPKVMALLLNLASSTLMSCSLGNKARSGSTASHQATGPSARTSMCAALHVPPFDLCSHCPAAVVAN